MQKAKDIVGEQYLLKKQLQNENNQIRKVKNDKKDALSIAKIGKFQNIKLFQ